MAEIRELVQYFSVGHGALYPMFFVYSYTEETEVLGWPQNVPEAAGAQGRQLSLKMVSITDPVQVLNITEDQLEDQIITYINHIAIDYVRPDLPYPFKLNAAASEIARKTRRGAGNVVISSLKNLRMLGDVYPPVQNSVFSFVEREDIDDILVGYVGPHKPDRCIAVTKQSEDTFVFYAHPFAHNYWVRLTP